MLRRIFRNAFLGITRHSGLSLATVLVITLTFGATSTFALFAFGAEKIIDYYESRALVTAFFNDEATEEQVLALRDVLLKRPGVTEVTYTSKEQAFSIYSEQFKDKPELLENIPTNILPASLDVRTDSLDDLPAVAESFEGNELVEEVAFYQDVVERFRSLVSVARTSLLVLMGIFFFISVVVVLITIGLIIHSMEEEIDIMSLLGATKSYIRIPFIIQGAVYGLVAAIISGGLLTLAIPLLFPHVRTFFSNVPLPDPSILFQLQLVGLEAVAGIIIGAIGSWIAVNRYLRV
ncbi:MAG: permease-like cell division protein FtsX [Patescibacteria group bacterium]|nr:MAG: permease-like cell division protein FtsX [Patescibacteria group bacterium]